MNKQSMLCRAGAALTVSLSLIGLTASHALSKRAEPDGTAYLFDGADCTTTGSDYRSQTEKSKPNATVAIARQVYDPLFYMQAAGEGTVTLSCRAKPRYGILDLEMGVSDLAKQGNVELNVGVYQGGKLRHFYEKLRPGSMVNVVLDLNDVKVERNPNNIAIEVSCIGNKYSSRCDLTFIKARFYPGSTRNSGMTNGSEGLPQVPENQPPGASSSRQDVPTPSSSRQDASGSPVGETIVDTIEKPVTDILKRGLNRLFK